MNTADRPDAIGRVRAAVPALGALSAMRFVTAAREMIDSCAASLAVEFNLQSAAARAGLMAAIGETKPPKRETILADRGTTAAAGETVAMVNPLATDEMVESGRRCLPPGDRE